MSASAWLHPAPDIRRWRADCPGKQLACLLRVCLIVPAEPHLESGCPGLLLALVEKRNCPPHQGRHLRLCSFLSLILKHCTSNNLFGGENVPPPPNPTCTLDCVCPNLEGSRACWTRWSFLILCLRAPYSALRVLVSCFLTPPPQFYYRAPLQTTLSTGSQVWCPE